MECQMYFRGKIVKLISSIRDMLNVHQRVLTVKAFKQQFVGMVKCLSICLDNKHFNESSQYFMTPVASNFYGSI